MAGVLFIDTQINAVLTPGQSSEWVWHNLTPDTSVWTANAVPVFDIQVEGTRSPFTAEVVRQWRSIRTVQVGQQLILEHEFFFIVQNNGNETVNYTVFLSAITS